MTRFLMHCADAVDTGHLLIHARAPAATPLSLKVEDLAGRRVFAVHEPDALVDVALPAGRYRVTVRDGEVERSYPAVVEPSGLVDLHVRLNG